MVVLASWCTRVHGGITRNIAEHWDVGSRGECASAMTEHVEARDVLHAGHLSGCTPARKTNENRCYRRRDADAAGASQQGTTRLSHLSPASARPLGDNGDTVTRRAALNYRAQCVVAGGERAQSALSPYRATIFTSRMPETRLHRRRTTRLADDILPLSESARSAAERAEQRSARTRLLAYCRAARELSNLNIN